MRDDLSMILESPTVEQVATDFVFTEGPLWHPDGLLLFVDIRRSLLLRWQPGKGVEIVLENTGEGHGLTFDRQGRLIMCEGGNRRLSRTIEHSSSRHAPLSRRYALRCQGSPCSDAWRPG